MVATLIDSTSNTLTQYNKELSQRARAISREQRRAMIASLDSIELNTNLIALFMAMEPNYRVQASSSSAVDMVVVKEDTITKDVIGIAIKRGNIVSKTLAEVEPLIVSVNQIFNTKVEVVFSPDGRSNPIHTSKPIPQTVSISKVFVVVTGAISNRGINLLNKQSIGPVEVFDLDWLVEKFTETYPQVFYEGAVINLIQSKIQDLETRSWRNNGNLNLSDCFVEPIVRRMDIPLTIDDMSMATTIATRRLPFSKLRTIISSKQRIILVGDPGTGKSAALSKLGIELLKHGYTALTKDTTHRTRPDLPIMVTAKEMLVTTDLAELLSRSFGPQEMQNRIKVSVLMIDALDEVPAPVREEVVDRCRSFSEALDCALIITSRKIDLVNSTPKGYRKYELLPFEASQALQLFEKLHGHDELLQTLRGELNKIRYQIPMVPLSLLLLLELVEEKREVPASLTELYERYTDNVLGRHDKKKGIEVLFEYTIKKRFLAHLAYTEFLEKGRLEIPISDYHTFLTLYADDYSLEKNYIDQFVTEIERAGVLRVDEDEVIFGHRSFLDYFAAFYMFDKRDELENIEHLIIERYFDDFWCDTIFFYIGHKREIGERLLDKLLSYKTEERPVLKTTIDKFLIGRLLQAGWHSPTRVKLTGLEAAFGLMPDLRQGLIEYCTAKKWKIPGISADFFLLMLTDLSFRSAFLAKEMKVSLERELEGNNIGILVSLFWAIKPFIHYTEAKSYADRILAAIESDASALSEDKARSLVMLKFVQRGDRKMTKVIQRKINLIQQKDAGIFKKLLPKRLPGSMPTAKRSCRAR
jgi:type IV secretory pathway ATPase VirB11/archaellum biosynthesis ATPase